MRTAIKTFLKFLTICMAFMAPLALFGQGYTVTRMNSDPGANIDSLLRVIRSPSGQPATLVLFDTQDKAWGEAFDRIRREDPFAAINLRFLPIAIGQGAGDAIREKEGWPANSSHWAIFNVRCQILAHGAALPTSAQLAEACANANIISKVEMYRRYLRDNPNNEEARSKMLVEMVAAAELRTRSALGAPEAKNEQGTQTSFMGTVGGGTTQDQDARDPTAEQVKSLPELAADADERIWRDYCTEFQRYLEGALWQANGNMAYRRNMVMPFFDSAITSAWAIFSPIAKAAYARAAAKVEDALMRQPSSMPLWDLWMTMHKTGSGAPMKKLLATLQPSPTLPLTDWPPPFIRQAYIKVCRENEDWRVIQELVVPVWESAAQMMSAWLSVSDESLQGRPARSILFNQGFWASTGEAYLEALLKLGLLPDAQQMMSAWESGSGWPGAFLAAADMAEKLGYDSAAKAWRAKGEKK